MAPRMAVSLSKTSLIFITVSTAILYLSEVGNARVEIAGFSATVNTRQALGKTSEMFVSVTLDAGNIVNHFKNFNPENPFVLKLAQALYPAYLRVGGTGGDSLIFVDQLLEDPPIQNSTFTASIWDRLNLFAKKANFALIYGLSSLYRPGVAWDPDNAMKLLNYSASKGYFLDWELGNDIPCLYSLFTEPNIYGNKYNRTVDPQQLGRDFGTLRSKLNSMPYFQTSKLYGPDVTQDSSTQGREYLENFMKTGSKFIDAMTFHHYYMNGRTARPSDFISPEKLDSFMESMTAAHEILQNFTQGTQKFWLGETSSAYDGGVPGVSDTYVAGFMWLDKLGISARSGAEVVLRQAFVGGNYGLVQHTQDTYSPNPDYWLTIIYKLLVGQTVLEAQGGNEKLRLYSHCTNSRAGYGPGAVTFYMMSLYNTTQYVSFSQFEGKELHLYILSSGDPNTLISRSVSLNGNVLAFSGGELPPLPPVVQNSTTVAVAPFTMGFVVVPKADAASCAD